MSCGEMFMHVLNSTFTFLFLGKIFVVISTLVAGSAGHSQKKQQHTETVQLINFSRGLPFTGPGRFQKKIVRFERRPAAAAGPAWSAGRSTRAEAAAWPVVASAGRSTRETATWPVASASRSTKKTSTG